MGRPISLFSEYKQKENRVTNYCGLMMKLVYEESPRKFEELLANLIGGENSVVIGPSFTQQTKEEKSIPDLSITQESFSIFFETKLTDWHYSDQIDRHINGFNKSTDKKILFLLANEYNEDRNTKYKKAIDVAKNVNIILRPITFEEFIDTLEGACVTEYLKNLLDEFKSYLDSGSLLPRWKYMLDVVNCRGTLEEIENNVYMCPETGGAYRHRRAKYFGVYADKKVSKIFEVDALVSIKKNLSNPEIKWKNNLDIKDDILIKLAKEKINSWSYRIKENENTPLQVFLLSNGAVTNFIKDSDGGLQSSKMYFWDIAKDRTNAVELANKLNGKNWGEYRK